MKKHLELNFYGNLRGLGVMQFAVDTAKMFGIKGYTRRLPTGAIHVEAEGEEEGLHKFLNACREREEWRSENEESIVFSNMIIGYDRFYIRKQG